MVTIGDLKAPWSEGLTVARALAMLDDDYDYAVVRINGKLVCKPNFESTPVDDHAVIVPIPMIAGG